MIFWLQRSSSRSANVCLSVKVKVEMFRFLKIYEGSWSFLNLPKGSGKVPDF